MGDERGATLILAMAFLFVVSIVVVSLSSWVGNDLSNTAHFTSAHALETAANDAVETAVQTVRYSPASLTVNAMPPVPCWTISPTPSQLVSTGLPTFDAWCSTVWAPDSASTRTVTISACLSTATATSCQSTPELQAVVVFDDYSYPIGVASKQPCIAPTATPIAGRSTCGEGMTVKSWVFNPVVPAITGINKTSGTSSGGTTVIITGTGFASGTTVNFVDATSGTNVVLSATNVTVTSATSITATTPAMSNSSNDAKYNITVTTPEGSGYLTSHWTYT